MQKFPVLGLIICSQLGSSSLVLERDWKKHQCYFSHNAGSFVSRLSSAISASAAYLTIFGNVCSSFFLSDTRSRILVWGNMVGVMDAWTSKTFSWRRFRSREAKGISGKGRWILLYKKTHQVFLPPPKTFSVERSRKRKRKPRRYVFELKYWTEEPSTQTFLKMGRWRL